MKAIFITIFSLFLFLNLSSQDVARLTREADRLEALPDETGAFNKFIQVLKIDATNMYALTKCSELCSRIGQRQTSAKARDDYYDAAKTYAGIALKINPNSSDANCVLAIVLGRSSMTKSGKEKISSAKEIKKHVDLAILNNPKNYKAWHVLGRWEYEISNLSFLERVAVKLLYGGVPQASMKESVKAFEMTRSLEPLFILNYLEMAKAYKKNDQKDKAIAAINIMLSLPDQTEDDPSIKAQGRKLLKEWQ